MSASDNEQGINKLQPYHTVMLLEPVILATLALYSMLMTSSSKNIYCPAALCDSENVSDNCVDSIFSRKKPKPTQGHNASIAVKEIRDTYVSIL